MPVDIEEDGQAWHRVSGFTRDLRVWEKGKVGQLNLLQKLFGKIIIPQEVYNEVTTGNHRAASVVPAAQWIEVFTLQSPAQLLQLQIQFKLDLGEAATIILAEELKANRVL